MVKGTETFKKVIKGYLDNRAAMMIYLQCVIKERVNL